MKIDYSNAPVTEPYARDLILEAHARLLNAFPSSAELHFVEFYEVEGIALVSNDNLVFYHPDLIKQVDLDNLTKILREVLHCHMMNVTEHPSFEEDLTVPAGTTLH